ncbi:hypothetical protein [Halomonas huangheensis]|uniref:Uncharacterized protein n=1 Tax=Halomonas huangheensis TaxID=1178482 RepID=W1NCE1_9GAMM|nr:hypothetical protein [Halomonas huangheensis]ALM52926.1 hypothetical protein AR456_12005 [Halomonas huangheensis]ERL53153.1 hypothetical protein BJB45_17915 [Halomonas huangheensis]
MKIKLISASLLLAALPLAAQADPATERALQLSEPLSAGTHSARVSEPVADVSFDLVAEGNSAAIAQSRLKLRAQQQDTTDITISEHAQQLALNATR